jgi:hypothetical protein
VRSVSVVTIAWDKRAIVTMQEGEEDLRRLHLSAMKRNDSCGGGERRKYVSRRFCAPTDD